MRVHFTRWVLVPAIMVGWLSFSGTARAQANKRSGPARTVEDDGDFFSEKAKQKANEEIAQIKRKFDKDLFEQVLRECAGNKPEAARRLGFSTKYFYEKCKDLGVGSPPETRKRAQSG